MRACRGGGVGQFGVHRYVHQCQDRRKWQLFDRGLATGTDYQVCFDASGATGGTSDANGYANQCHNNQSFNSPTPVSVTTGAATTGINAVLVGNP